MAGVDQRDGGRLGQVGAGGRVQAPPAGDVHQFLRADGGVDERHRSRR
ncbi:hypothetical protein ACIBJE_05125 [Micromonospora sp. NPDC050187]